MSKSKSDIIYDISEHFKQIPYKSCYIGITSDAKARLFDDHKVSEDNGHWIYRTAASDDIAREIEKYFIEKGMDGGGGGGDKKTKMVYAYKKTSGTNP